jgi:large subunit ribosomal protein L7/L12
MDAKKLVDALPAPIKEHISPVEAEGHKKTLVDAGAEVEIK